ncbi:hypothetical protein AtNW77_Chr5g0102041 [Arabidopsis thaliana]
MTPAKLETYIDYKEIYKAIRFAYDENISFGVNVKDTIFSLSEKGWDVEKGIQTLADMGLISISRERGIIMQRLVRLMSTNPSCSIFYLVDTNICCVWFLHLYLENLPTKHFSP